MPPLTHSCYDIMETREWAGSTMDSLFSNQHPLEMDPTLHITFGKNHLVSQHPDQKQQQQQGQQSDSKPTTKPRRASVLPHRLQRFNQIRRSFSVLDHGIHPHKKSSIPSTKQNEPIHHHNDSNQYHVTPSPPHSVCLDDYSTRNTTPILACLTLGTQSAPVSPTDISRRPSFSTRIIRKTFDMKTLLVTTFDRQRKDCLEKEREALALWQHTFEQSLLKPIITSSSTSPRNSNTSNSLSSDLSNTNFTTNVPSSTRNHNMKYSRFIMMELLSTEENYLEGLYIIKTKFMDPLVKASQQSQPIINHRDIRTIFAFIPQLLLLSATFVRNLRSAIDDDLDQTHSITTATDDDDNDNDNNNEDNDKDDDNDDDDDDGIDDEQDPCKIVAHVIYDLEPSFDVFLYYTLNFRKSRKCLNKLDCDALCHQLLQDTTIWRKETKRMNLSDFLITPIQRITRYCLILKDLQKHSPENILLDRSIKCLSSLAFAMNEIQ